MWEKVLTEQQIEILKKMPEEIKENFVLSGGTCLSAFYLGHRKSEDLDFFSFSFNNKMPFSKIETILKKNFSVKSHNRIFDRNIFNIMDVKIEFVPLYFKRINEPKKEKDFNIFIESLEDICANKIIAMTDRREIKDYIDIFFVSTKKNINFQKLIDLAKEKYNGAYEYLLNFDILNSMKDDFKEIKFLEEKVDFNEIIDFYSKFKSFLINQGVERIWKNLEN